MTRATSLAQDAGHYEFGVWAMKGSALADYQVTTNGVMGNYLVAYTNGTDDPAYNTWYKDIKANASTWGNAPSGDVTDAATGVSSWFYEGITSSNHATYTTPEVNQILKYWDQAQDYHYFFAYMPYNKTTEDATYNADKVAFSYHDTNHGTFEFTNLSSFYTSPVTGKQVATAAAKENSGTKPYTDDNEILNDNEALYAYTEVPKAQYGEDVPLEFKHINAKVQIAFYEVIDGYKVKLIDVVPQSAVDANAKIDAVVPGVHFSPSTDVQGHQPMTVKQTTDLPTYYEAAEVTATHVEDGTATLALKGATIASPNTIDPVKKNLVFAATNKTGQPDFGGVTEYIGETSSTNMTKSATTLYVLPNYNKSTSKYITDAQAEDYDDNGEVSTGHITTTYVADKTGYTLHVSYQLIPEDGTAPTTVYDARVHIDAQYCQWEAGKAYTYIFKITNQTNGTTDPNKIDPATIDATDDPWIDPVDPRVPDDPALIPIVFDGVTVTDYEATETGKVNETDEWVLTDPASWSSISISSAERRYSPALLTSADYTSMLGSAWQNAASDLTMTPTYDKKNRIFTFTCDDSKTFKWRASNQTVNTTASLTYDTGSGSETVTGTHPVVYDYAIYVWSATPGNADEYKASATSVTYGNRTVVETWDISGIIYVKTCEYTAGNSTPTSEAWTKNGVTITGSDVTDAKTAINTTPANSTVKSYTNPTVTYGAVAKTADKTPTKAYAIVKSI